VGHHLSPGKEVDVAPGGMWGTQSEGDLKEKTKRQKDKKGIQQLLLISEKQKRNFASLLGIYQPLFTDSLCITLGWVSC